MNKLIKIQAVLLSAIIMLSSSVALQAFPPKNAKKAIRTGSTRRLGKGWSYVSRSRLRVALERQEKAQQAVRRQESAMEATSLTLGTTNLLKKLNVPVVKNISEYLDMVPRMDVIQKKLPPTVNFHFSTDTRGKGIYGSPDGNIVINPKHIDLNNPQDRLLFTLALFHQLHNLTSRLHPSKELKEKFIERTSYHINLVNHYARKMGVSFRNHDDSKFTVLLDGYCYFSKPKEERTAEEQRALDLASLIHIVSAPHHPEFWTNADLSEFTRGNTAPNGVIDVTRMHDAVCLTELCADWSSVAYEKGNTPMEWFNKVNGVRWRFDDFQQRFIKKTIEEMWDGLEEKINLTKHE